MTTAALLGFVVACMVVCAFLRTRRAAAIFSIAIFLILTLVVPLGDVVWKCMDNSISEACVWGKSLLLMSLAFGVVTGAVVGGGAWFLAIGLQKRRRYASGATDSSHALHAGEEE